LTIEDRVHVVYVLPPAIERAAPIWESLTPQSLVICADYEQAVLWADAAPPPLRAHAVTGLARTAALLKEGRVGLLAGAPADLAALVARTVLKPEAIQNVVLAWPESFFGELDQLLAESSAATRIVLSWNPPALNDFLERHARRPRIVGDLPLDPNGNALGPVAAARYTVVSAAARRSAEQDLLDRLRAVRPYVWRGGPVEIPEGADAILAAALPARAELHALAASGTPPVLLALAAQLPYLRSIAMLTALPVSAAADRAQDRAEALRRQIVDRLNRGDVDAELAALAPLFEEHDPALVAGALLAIARDPAAPERQPLTAVEEQQSWTRIFASVGRKDRASAKDLVGALIKEVGLQKGQIGKIDVRESFSLIEVAPAVAEEAVRRLTGVSIRGRRVAARPDRS
jgi:hypothetical protein